MPNAETVRSALITGATRGIGREVARQLAALGYRVVLGARDAAKGDAVAAEIGHGASALALDVADPASIDRAAAEIGRRFGGVDVLVNNAGIHYDSFQRPTNADWTIIREAFETNFFGAWRLAQVSDSNRGRNASRLILLTGVLACWFRLRRGGGT